jgi:two-component system sensor histidine kinase KdpD
MFLNGTRVDRQFPEVFWRYALSLVSLAAALGLSLWLESVVPSVFVFPFLTAIVVSARFAGRAAAVVATLLSAMAINYYLLPPLHAFGLRRQEAPFFVSFIACALVVGWLTSE